jgi:hypothetical protein
VTEQDVRAFIAHRVPKYRCSEITVLDANPDLALFPFATTAPEKAIGGGSKPLGGVNTWLVRQIERQHRDLIEKQNLIDAKSAELSELRARLIGL